MLSNNICLQLDIYCKMDCRIPVHISESESKDGTYLVGLGRHFQK